MKTEVQANGLAVRHMSVKGKRMVMLDEADFDRLLRKADEWEPAMPEPDADGNYPAAEALRVSLARRIIRDRRRLGLSAADLDKRAGIRPQTLFQIEHAEISPSVRVIEKIDRALRRAQN